MSETPSDSRDALRDQHLRIGWWGLLLFLTLGIGLEVLHAFKVGWYMDVDNNARRLMFTLAHTHGTLVSLVHLVFALSAPHLGFTEVAVGRTSKLLTGALVLLPTGFFLGGFFSGKGDPGIGVALVPPGALLLWLAVFFAARATTRGKAS